MDETENEGGMEDIGLIPLDLPAIKLELVTQLKQVSERGLLQSTKWLSEMIHALKDVKLKEIPSNHDSLINEDDDEYEVYFMAKSYFDLKEYDRCGFFAAEGKSPRVMFLHYYSRYLSGEKKRMDNSLDNISKDSIIHLKDLRAELQKIDKSKTSLDGYCLYLYGVILKRLKLYEEAKKVLIRAIHREPIHWGAWLELSCLIFDRNAPAELDLPDHWIKHLFLAHTYLELQLNEQALGIYFGLQSGGLQDSTYILAQVAIAFHNMREVDQAVEYFKKLSENDPFRLDNLDTYSNLLYVKEQRVELGHLAHRTVQIDKYRTETCCVIGNYYSLRSQHQKAVISFQRALKLNPTYLSAWTLMGHEYMELKNTNAAIQSYRHAIEVNRRDYRAWYGLGQTYEILKMPFYCLYYYKQAQELRPSDSRMLVALGESYDKLDKMLDAMKCFWKAQCVGDIEGGIAIYQLAKLYEKCNDWEQAAGAYSQYVELVLSQGSRDHLCRAYRFLAQYYLKKEDYDEAYSYAQKCTEYPDTKEDAKGLLREIAAKRPARGESGSSESEKMNTNDNGASIIRIDENSGDSTGSRRGDLAPMNLLFTNTDSP